MKRLVWVVLLAGCAEKAAPPVRVAAASDLTEVFAELGRRFEAETKTKVVFSFGSSGLLAKQIAEGAPFDVFAAANARFVEDTVKAGACDGTTTQKYARGRLALWGKGAIGPITSIADEANRRIAIANPEHAPYGRAAKEALEHAGLWDAVASRIVYAENVRQALQYAETGNAEVAMVAWSNVVHRDGGTMVLVDEALHTPIEQSMVRCSKSEAAKKFVEFLGKPESRALLLRSGFSE